MSGPPDTTPAGKRVVLLTLDLRAERDPEHPQPPNRAERRLRNALAALEADIEELVRIRSLAIEALEVER